MTDVPEWMKPSPALKRLADAPARHECPTCTHRHPHGEVCGYPVGGLLTMQTCRCEA